MALRGTLGDFGLPDSFVPDRVLYGAWPRLKHAPWTIDAIEGSTAPDACSMYRICSRSRTIAPTRANSRRSDATAAS